MTEAAQGRSAGMQTSSMNNVHGLQRLHLQSKGSDALPTVLFAIAASLTIEPVLVSRIKTASASLLQLPAGPALRGHDDILQVGEGRSWVICFAVRCNSAAGELWPDRLIGQTSCTCMYVGTACTSSMPAGWWHRG